MAVAYQALWHFEADEDKQRAEVFYMDAQLELMRQMAVQDTLAATSFAL